MLVSPAQSCSVPNDDALVQPSLPGPLTRRAKRVREKVSPDIPYETSLARTARKRREANPDEDDETYSPRKERRRSVARSRRKSYDNSRPFANPVRGSSTPMTFSLAMQEANGNSNGREDVASGLGMDLQPASPTLPTLPLEDAQQHEVSACDESDDVDVGSIGVRGHATRGAAARGAAVA